jgi:uncharacterized protein YjaZ
LPYTFRSSLFQEEGAIREKLRKEGELVGDIFHGQNRELPNRTGYYIGYRMVEDFIQRTGETDLTWLLEHSERISMDFPRT